MLHSLLWVWLLVPSLAWTPASTGCCWPSGALPPPGLAGHNTPKPEIKPLSLTSPHGPQASHPKSSLGVKHPSPLLIPVQRIRGGWGLGWAGHGGRAVRGQEHSSSARLPRLESWLHHLLGMGYMPQFPLL
uniref:Uncharacterized protein n=1 Tax=Pipistrellus kuhlii TaxID=59472 RepID=A0A7J7UTH4_PIPKU|nr:hypothetical protein mPipKuh1_008700 [Pipistrellus kuhlii]